MEAARDCGYRASPFLISACEKEVITGPGSSSPYPRSRGGLRSCRAQGGRGCGCGCLTSSRALPTPEEESHAIVRTRKKRGYEKRGHRRTGDPVEEDGGR